MASLENNKSFKKELNNDIFSKMTEVFSTYLNDMFSDFSKVILKKLKQQEKKISKNEKILHQILRALASKRHNSSTSLQKIQSQKLLHQRKLKKVSSFREAKQMLSMQKINEILLTMETNLQYLQNSIANIKSKNQIQDPQNIGFPSEENKSQFKTDYSTQPNQASLSSKITKLSNKISKLAKQGSVQQIQKQNQQIIKGCFPKSKSLLSISSRKYYPVSCPKKYQCFQKTKENNWSDILIPNEKNNSIQYGFKNRQSFESFKSEALNTKSIQNKMPLINHTNNILKHLISSCQDQADANVIKFHLKKSLNKIDEIMNKKIQPKNKKNVLIQLPDKQNISQKIYAVPEYFSNKINTKELIDNNRSQENLNLNQCSIQGNMANDSQPNLNWIKQNYETFHSKGLNQNDVSFSNYGSTNNNSKTETQNSRNKKQYFQRTSNGHKINMLKKRLKSQFVKI